MENLGEPEENLKESRRRREEAAIGDQLPSKGE